MTIRDALIPVICAAALGVLAVGAAGCDSGTGETFVVDDTLCQNGAACGAGGMSTYPGGTYGKAEGSKLANLEFLDTAGVATDLQDLRGDGNAKLMLISTTAEWCTACIEEQPKLEALYREFACDGLDVTVSIFQDLFFSPADETHAALWKQTYGLSFNVLADPEFVWESYYDSQLTPMTMLVDLCTMEIIEVNTGFDETLVRSLIESRL